MSWGLLCVLGLLCSRLLDVRHDPVGVVVARLRLLGLQATMQFQLGRIENERRNPSGLRSELKAALSKIRKVAFQAFGVLNVAAPEFLITLSTPPPVPSASLPANVAPELKISVAGAEFVVTTGKMPAGTLTVRFPTV